MRSWRRTAVLAGATGVVAVALVVSGWWWSVLVRATTAPETTVVVEPGQTARAILEDLRRHRLLPSVLAGRLYLRLAGRGRSPHWGHYRIPAGSRPVDVLERLLEGRVELLTVTVVEGSSAGEVADAFIAAGVGEPQEWLALVEDPGPIVDLAPRARSLEGFLFPDTYRFAVGVPPARVVEHLTGRFRRVWEASLATSAGPWGEPLEVVTLASLVEAETSLEAERARIAGVFMNRLRRGMLLQCDPTVVFALKRRGEWTGRLLRVHWLVDDPYNTYRYPGLPPGPVNSPGRAALIAALEPERHDFLYFVARPDGGHAFSRSLAEHNRAVAHLMRSRR